MAGRFVIILLLLAGAGPGVGGQKSGPNASSPTLTETTDWIASHLVGIAHGSARTIVTYTWKKGKPPRESERQTANTHESVSSAKFSGCSLTLEQLTKGDDYSVITTSIIPIGRLTKASWSVVRHDETKTEGTEESTTTTIVPASVTVLTLESSTSVVSYRRKSTGSIPLEWITTPFEGTVSTLTIGSDDAEMPPRLVNAFNRAIQLCHVDAKPEPF
jgi:hypothetical protein